MSNILHVELARAFRNKRLFLIFILGAISFSYGFLEINATINHGPLGAMTIWQEILMRGKYGFFAAIMAVLPFADSLSKDKNDRMLDVILTRTSYRHYLHAKTLAVAISGACAVLLPALILLAGCCLTYPAQPIHIPNLYFNESEVLNRDLILVGTYLNPSTGAYLGLSLLFLGLFGATNALLAMGISFHTKNSLLVLATAFVGYSFGYYIIPTSRHLNWMTSPSMALIPEGNLYSPLLQYSLMIVFFLANLLIAGKKEQQVLN
jgi:hypothetical protein